MGNEILVYSYDQACILYNRSNVSKREALLTTWSGRAARLLCRGSRYSQLVHRAGRLGSTAGQGRRCTTASGNRSREH